MADSAMHARPLGAKIVLAVVIVGFVALAVRVAMTLDQPPDALEQKLAAAERYLYYRITPGTGPRFELDGSEATLRLVTHAVVPVPAAAAYDPAWEIEYGVRIALDLGGGKTWTRDVFTKARRSKARRVAEHGGIWLDENTFSLEPGLELADDRLLVVALPAGVPAGATVGVTLIGDAADGYLRAYTPIPREDVERKLRELPPADRSRYAERVSYLPWDRLATADLTSLRFAERRLPAVGKEGVDYETRTFYTTEFRIRFETVLEQGTLVTPDHAVAVNVLGPARLELVVARPLAGEAPAGTLTAKLTGEGTLPPPKTFALPMRDGPVSYAIEVPAGVFTLSVEATAPAQLEVQGPASRPVALGGVAGAPILPDEGLVPMYLAQPAGPPVTIAIDGPPDLLGRVIRVDVRPLASEPVPDTAMRAVKLWPGGEVQPAGGAGSAAGAGAGAGSAAGAGAGSVAGAGAGSAAGAGAGAGAGSSAGTRVGAGSSGAAAPGPRVVTANLTLEAVDAGGRVVARSTAKIESEVSRFEAAQFFGKLVATVCEPVNVRFIVPPSGREVRLRTDRPSLLQMSTAVSISPPQDKLDVPYDTVPLTTMLWRYARYLERGWLTVRAHDHDALMPERVAALATQARIEPREVPPAPELNGVALPPAGRLELQTVVERIASEETAQFVSLWTEGHYTRLVPGRAVKLDLSRFPSRPTLPYWATGADTDVVGASVRIAVDGQTAVDKPLAAAHGAIQLPAGLRGVHAVAAETAAPIRLLIDRPPAPGTSAELYALRSVYRIDAGRTVRVSAVKHGAAPQNVNIVVYARAAAADPGAPVRIVIDGGQPARLPGVAVMKWTLADRTLPMPPADRAATIGFANVARGGALYPRLIAISLGDDLPAGTHTIDLSVAGTAGVWGRFFTLENAPVAPRALQWRDATDTSDGGSP